MQLNYAHAIETLVLVLSDKSREVSLVAARALGRLAIRTGRIDLALQTVGVDAEKVFRGISTAVSKGKGTPTVSRRLLEVLRRHPTVRNNRHLFEKIARLDKQLYRSYERKIS